ncbi:uncharacterized protein LOC131685786 isoform X2 [Topomyia yanbarensis]|uniref:uncharacterized protein LOC131685786 isoform X2 n=1 Tax=Topomyia yanbarensis TaxID=2498891 RepID=UPI00273B6EB9|nr:uncharacterized protein LOC131685786 isoform X2 [Topomyia yanbarensis]
MSWPNNWQVQPNYAGYTTSVQPQVAPMGAAAVPNSYSTMTPDQYAQWQQWQQYQQQYAQWHAQYGEQYARQMGKPLPAVAAPMPMTTMAMPPNVPPPAIIPAQITPTVPMMAVAPPIPIGAAPPPPSEPHPDTLSVGQAPAPPPPATEDPAKVQKTAEELAFDEQFRKWEEEFDNWKRKNANHPDKSTYREYEKKFEDCRKKLVERREYLKKKRLAEAAAAAAARTVAPVTSAATVAPVQVANYQQQSQYNQPPPPPPPEERGGMDVGLFRNALGGGGTNSGGGIPGLDLIGDGGFGANKQADDVVEVIELDDDREEKPNVHQLNTNLNKPANPVNALASLLKDPKVSALLNVISANANGEGVNLSSLGNSELLQQIQNAAGAVINANQNGSPALGNQNQNAWPVAQPSLVDERSRSSFPGDQPSMHSGDERSRDIDDFSRGSFPGPMNNDFNRGPPPAVDFNRVPPPGRNLDGSFRGPPGNDFGGPNQGPPGRNFDNFNQNQSGNEANRGPPGRNFDNFNRNKSGNEFDGPNSNSWGPGRNFDDVNQNQSDNDFDGPNRGPPGSNFDRSNRGQRGRGFDNSSRGSSQGRNTGDFQRGVPPRGQQFNDFNAGRDNKRGSLPGRDFENFNRGPPPSHDFDERGPPPGHDPTRRPPPGLDNNNTNRGPHGQLNRAEPIKDNAQNFNVKVPPPLMDIDLSRPPPLFGSQPAVLRPQRSEQPSPALSSTSSLGGKLRNSRWGNKDELNIKQELEPEPIDKVVQPPIKEEPFNGVSLPDDEDPSLYHDPDDDLPLDDEEDEPCAVPKPRWMTEDEYQEIFDRFEHVEVFEERKYKMELAIRLLEQKKKAERAGGVGKPPTVGSKPSRFGSEPPAAGNEPLAVPLLNVKPPGFGLDSDSANNNNNNDNNNSNFDRWQGGMPKPIKQESGNFKRANPFANEDEIFRPKQVIDYSNGAPRVIDYGHSSGPIGQSEPVSASGQDWFNRGGDRGQPQMVQPGGRGNDGFQLQRFDYHHTKPTEGNTDACYIAPFVVDMPPHYTANSTSRLAAMHNNPNPQESNPCYPSKFILMNDNRPNRPRTKRGKRASSIRKQQQQKQDDENLNPLDTSTTDVSNQQLCKNDVPLVRPSDYELEMKRGSEDYPKNLPINPIVLIDELLLPPGRFKRHPRICFILRGIPGSGKSYLARMIKECEVKNGGQAPRVLSIDDYFLVESEEREPDPVTGRLVMVTKSEYQFDAEMEEVYMQNLVKAFKRTITEKLYNFVIVDCVNERLQHYNEFHNFARSNGFKESISRLARP